MDTQQDDGEAQGKLLDGWLTRKEVAEEIGVSTDTLKRWENRRVGPPSIQLGRKVLYRAEAFREWLMSRENSGRRAGGGR